MELSLSYKIYFGIIMLCIIVLYIKVFLYSQNKEINNKNKKKIDELETDIKKIKKDSEHNVDLSNQSRSGKVAIIPSIRVDNDINSKINNLDSKIRDNDKEISGIQSRLNNIPIKTSEQYIPKIERKGIRREDFLEKNSSTKKVKLKLPLDINNNNNTHKPICFNDKNNEKVCLDRTNLSIIKKRSSKFKENCRGIMSNKGSGDSSNGFHLYPNCTNSGNKVPCSINKDKIHKNKDDKDNIDGTPTKSNFECPRGTVMGHYDNNEDYSVYCYNSRTKGCRIPPGTSLPGKFKGKSIGTNTAVGDICPSGFTSIAENVGWGYNEPLDIDVLSSDSIINQVSQPTKSYTKSKASELCNKLPDCNSIICRKDNDYCFPIKKGSSKIEDNLVTSNYSTNGTQLGQIKGKVYSNINSFCNAFDNKFVDELNNKTSMNDTVELIDNLDSLDIIQRNTQYNNNTNGYGEYLYDLANMVNQGGVKKSYLESDKSINEICNNYYENCSATSNSIGNNKSGLTNSVYVDKTFTNTICNSFGNLLCGINVNNYNIRKKSYNLEKENFYKNCINNNNEFDNKAVCHISKNILDKFFSFNNFQEANVWIRTTTSDNPEFVNICKSTDNNVTGLDNSVITNIGEKICQGISDAFGGFRNRSGSSNKDGYFKYGSSSMKSAKDKYDEYDLQQDRQTTVNTSRNNTNKVTLNIPRGYDDCTYNCINNIKNPVDRAKYGGYCNLVCKELANNIFKKDINLEDIGIAKKLGFNTVSYGGDTSRSPHNINQNLRTIFPNSTDNESHCFQITDLNNKYKLHQALDYCKNDNNCQQVSLAGNAKKICFFNTKNDLDNDVITISPNNNASIYVK